MTYSNLELAAAFMQTGELDDALAALNRHLDEEPHDDSGRRLRAEVLARMPGDGSLEAALDDLQALSIQTAHDTMLRSVVQEKLGNLDQALDTAAEGHQAFGDDDRLTERYLHLLRRQGQLDRARGIVGKLIAARPEDWRWQQWAGDLAVDAGEDSTAIDHYSVALVLIESRYAIDTGKAANQLSDPALSDAAAMTIGGIYARLLLARADACVRSGRFDQAEADYQSALTLIPDDPMIPFNLGLTAARRGNLETALQYCRPAYANTNSTLQTHMRAVLDEDATYAALRERLAI